jgi:hypothetical protein
LNLSPKPVPKAALDSARSLFSYGSTKPPADEADVAAAGDEAVIARLEQPETWTPRLRQTIGRAAATDPEVGRAVAAFRRACAC